MNMKIKIIASSCLAAMISIIFTVFWASKMEFSRHSYKKCAEKTLECLHAQSSSSLHFSIMQSSWILCSFLQLLLTMRCLVFWSRFIAFWQWIWKLLNSLFHPKMVWSFKCENEHVFIPEQKIRWWQWSRILRRIYTYM